MIDRSLKRQLLVFLAIVACLSMSIQNTGHLPLTETTTSTLQRVEASLVAASPLPTDTAGEGPCFDEYLSAESLSLVPGLPGTALRQQSRILRTVHTPLAEGFPAEVYRPPIATT